MGLLLALLACSSVERWPISGRVLVVQKDAVVLDHDPIPGFMDAMVMTLEVPDVARLPLEPGHRIEATLVVDGDRSRLEDITLLSVSRQRAPVVAVTPPLALGEAIAPRTVPLSDGTTTTLGPGPPTALTFLFTTCPLPEYCPLLATKLAALQARIRGNGRILAITLDPETDTPAVLQAYSARVGADPTVWQFGRLEPAALAALLDAAGVVRFAGETGIRHALRLLVLDAEGRLVRVESSNRWDVETVAAALSGED
ncbi:MAG: SCO family protein [Myxococcota bacterium]|nr:SCO family protein [Myxococcota bacterium]